MSQFLSIYREHFEFVWTVVRRLGIGSDAADDVVQEVFMVVHARIRTLERPEALRSWIYGVARRVVSHHFRSQRARLASAASLAAQPMAELPPTPFDSSEQNDELRQLGSLLEELYEAKREVFMMAHLDELSVPEIAEILQIPLNTAYSRLRAARQAFEAALASRSESAEQRGGTCRT